MAETDETNLLEVLQQNKLNQIEINPSQATMPHYLLRLDTIKCVHVLTAAELQG